MVKKNAEVNAAKADEGKFNEVLARMDIQDKAAQQAQDGRFVNEMAGKGVTFTGQAAQAKK